MAALAMLLWKGPSSRAFAAGRNQITWRTNFELAISEAHGQSAISSIALLKETAVLPRGSGVITQLSMGRTPDNLIPTRRSLLSRLKSWEDQESWRDFFNTYWRLVYAVAIKAGLNDTEAEEVVQETFIAVAKKIPDFKYDPAVGSFKSWLLHTTQWRISDQFRKRGKALPVGRGHSPATDRTATIERIPDPAGFKLEDIWDAEFDKSIFEAALEKVRRQVKANQYQMFDLYVIKNWPVQKVARALGVNAARVYLAKHRISALLKKEIKDLKRTMV